MSSTIHHGVTDSARMVCDGKDQKEGDRFYENILKLFKRVDGYNHHEIMKKHAEMLRDSGYQYKNKVNGTERSYIVVDGHNLIRSGRYMPGEKYFFQLQYKLLLKLLTSFTIQLLIYDIASLRAYHIRGKG